jgi:hypothetical protein
LKHFQRTIDLERDCEVGALGLIKKFKIGKIISPTDYARKANAYLYFWRYFVDRKTWYEEGHPPYDQKPVFSRMPSEILGIDDYMNISPEITGIFDKYMKRKGSE